MSMTEQFKRHVKKGRPSPLQNYLTEHEDPELINESEETKGSDTNKLEEKIYINNDIIDNNNDVVDNNVDVDEHFKNLALGKKVRTPKKKKVFTSFYLDPDLAETIDKMMKNAQKGDKSKLFNVSIRRYLKDIGAID